MAVSTQQLINDRYELLEKIGEGGMGIIFHAHDRLADREVAIKFMKSKATSSYIEDLVRFRKELEIITRFDHRGIVKVYEIGEYENTPYLTMELLAKDSLADLLQQSNHFGLDEATEIIIQLSEALNYVHNLGVIHRDIKPGNIFLGRQNGQIGVKLLDFGLALMMNHSDKESRDEAVGTFGYMSPEATGILNRRLDERSDLYSLGVVFYHLITGSPPFTAKEAGKLLHQQVAYTPPKPSKFNKNVPPVMDDIIMKLIMKDPDLRYQSAAGLLYDLEQYRNGDREFIPAARDRKRTLTYQTRLTGREEELSWIQKLCDDAGEGRGSICLLGGEAGIGKSRLVDDVRGYIYEQSGLFIGGKCFSQGNKILYQPFKDATDAYIRYLSRLSHGDRERMIARLHDVLGDLGEVVVKFNDRLQALLGEVKELTPLEPERENQRFLAVLSDFFCHLTSPGEACVLFLDDLQWADAGSLNLLRAIAGDIGHSNLLILGAYRDNEVGPDHGLIELKQAAAEHDHALTDIKLFPFDEATLNKLISRLLGEKEDQCHDLARYVLEKSKGNPFFAIEIIRQLVNEEAIGYHYGVWETHWDRVKEISVPTTLVDLILRRIEELNQDQFELLRYGAVIGSEFEIRLLVQLLRLPEERVITLIDEVIALQFLERSAVKGKVFFVHDRIRDAFYGSIGQADKKQLHLQVAETIEQVYQGERLEDFIFDLTHHYLIAENRDKLLQYAIPAAIMAKERYANEDAIKYYRIAIQLLEEKGETAGGRWLQLQDGLMAVCLAAGINDQVISIGQAILPHKHDALEKARVYRQMGNAYFNQGDLANCEARLAEGLALTGLTLPRTKMAVRLALARGMLTHILHCTFPKVAKSSKQQVDDALAKTLNELTAHFLILGWMYGFNDAEKFVASILNGLNFIESRIGESYALAVMKSGYSALCLVSTLFQRGLRANEEALSIMRRQGNDWWIAQCLQVKGFGHMWMGQNRKGIGYIQESIGIFQRIGDLWELGMTIHIQGWNYYCLGDYQSAKECLNKYLDICNKMNDKAGIYISKAFLAVIHLELGDFEEAAELGQQAQVLSLGDDKYNMYPRCEVLVDIGYLELEKGNYRDAIKYLEEARQIFEKNNLIRYYIIALYSYLADAYIEEVAHESLNFMEVDQLISKIGTFCRKSLKISRRWPNNHGLALRIAAKYYGLLGMYDWAERYLLKSIEQAQDTETNYELARSYYDYGNLLNSAKRAEEAKNCWTNAYNIFKEMGVKLYLEKCALLLGYVEPERKDDSTVQDQLRAERRMSTAMTTSRYLSSILDLDELLDKIIDKAMELTGSERGIILLYPEEYGQKLEVKVARNVSMGEIEEEALSFSNSIIARAISEKTPLIISDATLNEELKAQASVIVNRLRSVLCAPIITRGRVLGVIYLDNRLVSGLFNEEDLNVLDLIANQAGVSIENARLYSRAITDSLTGLYNRAFFDKFLLSSIYEAERCEKKLCLLMLDIDYFKMVNDRFGHQAGDQVLKSLAQVLKEMFRKSDVIARYGGEEFVVILNSTGIDDALAATGKIVKLVANNTVHCSNGDHVENLIITISIGLAEWIKGDDAISLIEKVDQALYQAKANGRNRLEVWQSSLSADGQSHMQPDGM